MATFCAYFDDGQCRSCGWIDREYSATLAEKEESVRKRLGLPAAFKLEPTVGSSPTGFRARAKMAVTGTTQRPIIGLFGETNLDEGRDLLACPIHHPRLNELVAALPDFILRFNLTPYQVAERRGELKGLIAFHSASTDELYLRFVLRSQECVSRIRKLLPELQAKFPRLRCVSANLQPVPHAILEGGEEIFITEARTIAHQIGEVRFRLSPQAFVQTHPRIADALYATAANWIGEAAPGKVLELFSGQGAFTLMAAQRAGEFLGIEINSEAVAAANEAALEQGFAHVRFKCLDAGNAEAEMAAFAPDLVLVNPPRRGLGKGAPLIKRQHPRHLIYSSCAVESLAEDVEKWADAYEIRRVQVFDMFPHTKHFETLVWLEAIAAGGRSFT